jgi:hypothetical protein
MPTKFEKAMIEGHEYIETQEFEEARAAFGEARKLNSQSVEAHYFFAFAAAEEIGSTFLRTLTDKGLSLGGLHITWRDALHTANEAQVTARVEKAYGKQKLIIFKMAAATARHRIASRCISPLRAALTMRPHYVVARELLDKLDPLAATSPLGMVASFLG